MENLKNLEKIAKIFQPQNIITSEEIDQVLKGIMEILASYKKGTDAINEETKAVVNILLDKVVQSNKQTLDKAETVLDNRMSDLETLLKDVKQMVTDVETMAGELEDGKDADEERIVEEVIARIRIPDPVNPILDTPETLRDKLASLKDEERLDKSAIKGLDKIVSRMDLDNVIATLQHQASFLINRGGIKSIVAGTNITVDNTDPSNPVVSASGGSGSPGGSTTQLQYNNAGAFGGISGATTDGTAVTYTAGNLIAADITASGSGGLLLQSNNGTDALLIGAGGGAGATFYGGVNIAGDVAVDTNVLYVDTTNNRTGLLTTAPTHTLTLASTSTGIALYNTADQTTNYERGYMQWSSNIFQIGTTQGGTGTSRVFRVGQGSVPVIDFNTASSPKIQYNAGSSGGTGATVFHNFISTSTASSGTPGLFSISPTINQSSTAGYTALLVNPTETTTGSGTKLLADFQIGGSSKAKIDNTGLITAPQIVNTPATITVTSNAGTVTRANRVNSFTNSSAATMTITMSTTSAADGDMVMVRIKDFSAVAQTITWVNTENSTVTAPTTSNGSTTLPLTVGFQYNSATSKWRCVASA